MKIGIVGGGQLGRMLIFEAKKMGFFVAVVDPTEKSPAGQIADVQIIADFKDETAIRKLAGMVDVITFEIELANDKVLYELIKKGKKINPSPKTLGIIRDKLKQKQFLKKNKIPSAEFLGIKNSDDIKKAGKKFGYPLLLKARTDAYDGRGNFLVRSEEDIKDGLEKLKGRPLYVEKFVPFIKELAVMVARSTKGEIRSYPVVETMHKNNICHVVIVPAPVDPNVRRKAEKLAETVMQKLKGAGVFGIEMFLDKKGNVHVNEIAPRVHNSGHYTIENAATSQFEQHIRAVCGLPLGETSLKTPAAVMVNILGERNGEAKVRGLQKALALKNVTVHIYGKKETRHERKMGHITAFGEDTKETLQRALKARKHISI
ncbi:MAG: 5-(carboxyamino)imidazole ribonucleotide synthase [Candidatus Levyibacteriota bacterium]